MGVYTQEKSELSDQNILSSSALTLGSKVNRNCNSPN